MIDTLGRSVAGGEPLAYIRAYEGALMNDIVPRQTLSRQGVAGFTAVAGGVGLLVMGALPGVVGIVIAGLVTAGGLAFATSKDDRRPGLVVAGAGVLGILSAAIGGFPGIILGLAGAGLIAYGGLSVYRFVRGLKSRM